jgi:hypothetical protein
MVINHAAADDDAAAAAAAIADTVTSTVIATATTSATAAATVAWFVETARKLISVALQSSVVSLFRSRLRRCRSAFLRLLFVDLKGVLSECLI